MLERTERIDKAKKHFELPNLFSGRIHMWGKITYMRCIPNPQNDKHPHTERTTGVKKILKDLQNN